MPDIHQLIESFGPEQVILTADAACGYRGVIVIDDRTLGPAVGGTRFRHYDDTNSAMRDALRLARGMTRKTALAGLPVGGGKSVILEPAAPYDRAALFRAHGRSVERLTGAYITAPDVGVAAADLREMRKETRHVLGTSEALGDSGKATAHGVHRAMRAAVRQSCGAPSLSGCHVVIQGCGSVGASLARELAAAGARLTVSDADQAKAAGLARELGAHVAGAEQVYDVSADVFAPCALGGILEPGIIARLGARVVVGGANNQLMSPEDADGLRARGITYVPAYLATAGGVILGYTELSGGSLADAMMRIDRIEETTTTVLRQAEADGVSPAEAADRLAREILERARAGQ